MASTHYTLGRSNTRGATPGVLLNAVSSAASSSGGAVTVTSMTVLANSLAADGQALRVTVYGTTAANGQTKVINVVYGGVTFLAFSTTGSGTAFKMVSLLTRTSATNMQALNIANVTAAAEAISISTSNSVAAGVNNTLAVTLNTATTTNDVVIRGVIVEHLPESPSPSAI